MRPIKLRHTTRCRLEGLKVFVEETHLNLYQDYSYFGPYAFAMPLYLADVIATYILTHIIRQRS